MKKIIKAFATLLFVPLLLTSCNSEPVVGPKGEAGKDGKDGVSVVSVEKTGTAGNVDTYTITFSNGQTTTFTITNGVDGKNGTDGVDGKNGTDGVDGKNGIDGVTPHIGENGNWWIGEIDTGVKAEGTTGEKGEKGEKGDTGVSYYDENEQGLTYYPLDDGTYGVGVGTASYLKEIVVPKTFRGKNVTKVVDYGFDSCNYLEKVTLPETINEIMDYGFAYCKNLSELVIGDTSYNLYIETERDSQILGLDSVDIGEGVLTQTNVQTIRLHDSNDDNTKIDVELLNTDSIKSVDLDIALNNDTDLVAECSLDVNKKKQEVDVLTYGLFKDIDATITLDNNSVVKTSLSGLGVTAKEYNFAHLNGTYPVLVFSLKLKDITNEGNIPTFVSLERNAAYDWDNLPYNVSTLPYLTKSAAINTDFHSQREGIADYIKELYELNNDSKFNLYCVDNYGELILQFLVGNGIPESNWNAVLLTDGNGTAYNLCKIFDVENPRNRYSELAENWKAMKEEIYDNGYNASVIKSFDYANYNVELLKYYPYVIAKEQNNVEYWVNRLRTGENLSVINARDSGFATEITNNVTSYYTNNLLAALNAEDLEAFKKLYHFNDEMFKEAEEQNKKVMIILGTSWTNEASSFYDYVRLTIELYGDDYVYYYKGHPGYPTSVFPGRQEELTELENDGFKLNELDNAIAAEVILFFNPDVYISGWETSTFDSIDDNSQEMACMIYAQRTSRTYDKYMDAFVVKLISGTTEYEELTLDATHQYYVVEFNNENFANQQANYSKHEFALFDATSKDLKFYKSSDTGYIEVEK